MGTCTHPNIHPAPNNPKALVCDDCVSYWIPMLVRKKLGPREEARCLELSNMASDSVSRKAGEI